MGKGLPVHATRGKLEMLTHAVMAFAQVLRCHALAMAYFAVKETRDEQLPSFVLLPPNLSFGHL